MEEENEDLKRAEKERAEKERDDQDKGGEGRKRRKDDSSSDDDDDRDDDRPSTAVSARIVKSCTNCEICTIPEIVHDF